MQSNVSDELCVFDCEMPPVRKLLNANKRSARARNLFAVLLAVLQFSADGSCVHCRHPCFSCNNASCDTLHQLCGALHNPIERFEPAKQTQHTQLSLAKPSQDCTAKHTHSRCQHKSTQRGQPNFREHSVNPSPCGKFGGGGNNSADYKQLEGKKSKDKNRRSLVPQP